METIPGTHPRSGGLWGSVRRRGVCRHCLGENLPFFLSLHPQHVDSGCRLDYWTTDYPEWRSDKVPPFRGNDELARLREPLVSVIILADNELSIVVARFRYIRSTVCGLWSG